ncbi:tRNA-specific adenosine deaminase [Suicoccus acidiformans]|uniref:tRNA-specific adenosine deaminase n=1 Tax=Suicoccus acidiformans TaxID=2036206 RepID=A0A347WHL5_9LACT|nr:tRNA adenosine(34) deaminase TadA [Suicoccus acidiformans]AXY24572.1 tRNA-specific adenosine deaminase [Suicoccus acidiformans]
MKRIDELSFEEQELHKQWMRLALVEAEKAAEMGEVPIGAIIVKDGAILARGHNLRESLREATAHAELIAIEAANQALDAWRIEGASLYVTVEPCPMCAGAIINARLSEVIYGTRDPKAGCVGSLMNLLEDERFNHQVEVIEGVLQEDCSLIISTFFRQLRQQRKEAKRLQKEKLSTD